MSTSIKYTIEDGGVPRFEPTMDQFIDFNEFMQAVHSIGAKSGIIKVVPPKEWVPNRSNYANITSDLLIRAPIKQHVTGRDGIYRVIAETQPDMSLKRFSIQSAKLHSQRSGRERAMMQKGNFEDLEAAYWKNVGFSNMRYGADSPGTLFDDDAPWNIRDLKSILSFSTDNIPGVNSPMLYFGEWKATFAIHVEDANLFSINYIHVGAPKQWYAIPASEAEKFELLAKRLQPPGMSCSEYLRHKDFLIKPARIREAGIKLVSCVHHEREFIITFARAYHQGFNHGWNIAESANFATEAWFPLGELARFCQCRSSTVRLDVHQFRAQVHVIKAARDELVAALELEGMPSEQLRNAAISMTLVEKYPPLLDALRRSQEQQLRDAEQFHDMSCDLERQHVGRAMSAANIDDDDDLLLALASEALGDNDYSNDDEDPTLREELLPVGVSLQLQCGYEDCTYAGVFRNRDALLRHYQTKHSTRNNVAQGIDKAKTESMKKSSKSKKGKRKRRTDDEEISQSEDVSDEDEDFSTSIKELRDLYLDVIAGKESIPLIAPSRKRRKSYTAQKVTSQRVSLPNNHVSQSRDASVLSPVMPSFSPQPATQPHHPLVSSQPDVAMSSHRHASPADSVDYVTSTALKRTSSRVAAQHLAALSSAEPAAQPSTPSKAFQKTLSKTSRPSNSPVTSSATTPTSSRPTPKLPTRLSARITDKWLRESTAELEAEQAKAQRERESEMPTSSRSGRSRKSLPVTSTAKSQQQSFAQPPSRSSFRIAQLGQADEQPNESARSARTSSRAQSASSKAASTKPASVQKQPAKSQSMKARAKSSVSKPAKTVTAKQPRASSPPPVPVRQPPTLRHIPPMLIDAT